MEYICGFTFAPFCGAGVLNSASAKESLKQMQEMHWSRLCNICTKWSAEKCPFRRDLLYIRGDNDR